MTRNEVEEIKRHFDEFGGGLRQEMAEQVGGLRQEFKQDLTEQVAGLRQELSELKQHVAEQVGGLRDTLGDEIAEVRRHAGMVAEDLRSEIRAVGDGVALANERIDHLDLRVDALTGEVRRGFAGVRAEVHRLHETDDELRRRIEAQEQRGA